MSTSTGNDISAAHSSWKPCDISSRNLCLWIPSVLAGRQLIGLIGTGNTHTIIEHARGSLVIARTQASLRAFPEALRGVKSAVLEFFGDLARNLSGRDRMEEGSGGLEAGLDQR